METITFDEAVEMNKKEHISPTCVLEITGICEFPRCTRPCSMPKRAHDDLYIYTRGDTPVIGVRTNGSQYKREYCDKFGKKLCGVVNKGQIYYTRFLTQGTPNEYVSFRGLGMWEYRYSAQKFAKIFYKIG